MILVLIYNVVSFKVKERTTLERTNSKVEKIKEYPRSYRIDSEIMDVLKETLERVNKAAPKKVGEARLIKALILLSKDIDNKILLKAIKEVW